LRDPTGLCDPTGLRDLTGLRDPAVWRVAPRLYGGLRRVFFTDSITGSQLNGMT